MPGKKFRRAPRKQQNRKKTLAKSVKKIESTLRKTQEFHTHDVPISSTPGDVENYISLSSIAEGDTQLTRTGRKICAKTISLHLRLQPNANNPNYVRVVLFVDQAGVSLTPNGYLNATTNPLSFRSVGVNVGRYRVLMDAMYVLDTNRQKYVIVEKTFNLKDMPINYYDGTADIPVKHGIWLMLIDDDGLASGNPCSVNGFSRLRFEP